MKYFQVPTISAAKRILPSTFVGYSFVDTVDVSSARNSPLGFFEESADSLEISSRSSSPAVTESQASTPTSVSSQRPPSPPSPIARMLKKLSFFRSRTSSSSGDSLTSQETSLSSPSIPRQEQLDYPTVETELPPPNIPTEEEFLSEIEIYLDRSILLGEPYAQYLERGDTPYPKRIESTQYFKDVFQAHYKEYPYIQGMITGSIVEALFHSKKQMGLYCNPLTNPGEEFSEGVKRRRLDQYLLQKIPMIYQNTEGNWMGFFLACNIYTGEWYATVSDLSQEPPKLTIIGSRAFSLYYDEIEKQLVGLAVSEPQDLPSIVKNDKLLEQLSLFDTNIFEQSEILNTAQAPDQLMKNCFVPFIRDTLDIAEAAVVQNHTKGMAEHKMETFEHNKTTKFDFIELLETLKELPTKPSTPRR